MRKFMLFIKYLKSEKKIFRQAFFISFVYSLFYYISIGYMRFESEQFNIILVDDMLKFILKTRALLLWEPIARIYTGIGITIDISPMNILLALFLMFIAFVNISLLIISIKKPKICDIGSKKSRVIAMLPAFLSGFACCAPTFVILWVSVFGGVATAFLVIARWALPFSILLLSVGAIQGIRKLNI
jgi:hypothetical protein